MVRSMELRGSLKGGLEEGGIYLRKPTRSSCSGFFGAGTK